MSKIVFNLEMEQARPIPWPVPRSGRAWGHFTFVPEPPNRTTSYVSAKPSNRMVTENPPFLNARPPMGLLEPSALAFLMILQRRTRRCYCSASDWVGCTFETNKNQEQAPYVLLYWLP